jgi:deaminated glutathione amidase
MKVAVAQFAAGTDKSANLARISTLAAQAARAGARLAVFPEGSMHGFGGPRDDLRPAAEPLDGPFVEGLQQLAADLELTLVAGMFEAVPGDERVSNTAVVVDGRSGLVASYRKRHLYDAFDDRESDRFRAGAAGMPIVQMDGFRTAIAVCYDLRFPAFIQHAADCGAGMLVVPSAWVAGPMKEEHWSVLVRARAIENTMYVAAAAMTGSHYCGRSMIVDPFGVVTSMLGEAEGVAVGEVSEERLAEVRARLPLIAQRRAELDASAGP